mmetsp:Transcript_51494/g.164683  ORF Transcript_51494/g.164683 Transcript_51494/m.164683 type:complete len:284 (-) Transcript_51494:196-1047(-)
MLLRRPHVLPERDHVHPGLPELLHGPQDHLGRLPEPEHDASLGHPGPRLLGRPQHRDRLVPVGAAVPHLALQLGHGLHVVRKHVQPAQRHPLHALDIPLEVRHQGLHQQARACLLEPGDGLRDVPAALVGEVVAVHRCEHDVVQPPACHGGRDVCGLLRVQRRGCPRGLDRAKAAAARARVPHDHDGRRGALPGLGVPPPALADVGALRLLAHRGELELPQLRLDLGVLLATREDGALEPVGLAGLLLPGGRVDGVRGGILDLIPHDEIVKAGAVGEGVPERI